MLTIELNMYHAVALGAFLFWMGGIITDKVRLLNRYCIPAPVSYTHLTLPTKLEV